MLPPKTFDRALIARRLARRQPEAEDFVTKLVLDDLEERLVVVTREFKQAAILSPDAGQMPLRGNSRNGSFTFERISTVLDAAVDPEALTLPRGGGYDLIVSVFDLQVVNDVVGFLSRIRRHLAPDGLFIAAAIGGDSLYELRHAFLTADAARSGGAFARVAPFIPLADAGGLLQRAGLALPVTDIETHTVRYSSPFALMQEIRALGASNPLADRPGKLMTPRLLAAAAEAYAEEFSDPDGRVRATLEIIWMSGWAPDESQQKPLQPGSAQVSLKDVLGRG
jgi:SAM-dependent methyltransferase